MILLYHSWEAVQLAVIQASGDEEVSVVRHLPVAVCAVRTGKYDLALVDVDASLDNVSALAQYVKVIGITSDHTGKTEGKALRAGAAGVIWMGATLQEIASDLEKFRKEGSHEYKPLRWNQVAYLDGTPVGQTQLNVLKMTADGLSASEIAGRLELREGYVQQVLRDLYKKFDVVGKNGRNKQVLLTRKAVQMGVVS